MTNNEPVREMSGGAHALDRLLAPVDGSEASELALDYAVRLHPEEIVLLRVESGGDSGSPAGSGADQPDWYQVHAEQVRRGLERQAEQFGTDRTRVSYKIQYGDAAEEIIDEARHHNLVVMTTRGAGAAGRAVFGSVADRVARHGASPVLLVRAEEPFNAPAEVNRIIVPLDGSDRAEQALPIATDLSNRLPAPVHPVRVVAFEDVVDALRSSPAEEGDNLGRRPLRPRSRGDGSVVRRVPASRCLPAGSGGHHRVYRGARRKPRVHPAVVPERRGHRGDDIAGDGRYQAMVAR